MLAGRRPQEVWIIKAVAAALEAEVSAAAVDLVIVEVAMAVVGGSVQLRPVAGLLLRLLRPTVTGAAPKKNKHSCLSPLR